MHDLEEEVPTGAGFMFFLFFFTLAYEENNAKGP